MHIHVNPLDGGYSIVFVKVLVATLCNKMGEYMGNMGGSEKTTENEQENDNHMMTNTSWKDPHVVDRTRNERAFGMSLRARRVLDACIIHFEAVG